jgi:hypothetical protein
MPKLRLRRVSRDYCRIRMNLGIIYLSPKFSYLKDNTVLYLFEMLFWLELAKKISSSSAYKITS